MQVAARRPHAQLGIDQPPQARGDRRRVDVPHVGVRNHRDIRAQIRRVRLQESLQIGAAHLLLALQHDSDPRRQTAGHRMPGAECLEPQAHLALVVNRAPGNDAFALRTVHHHRLERRTVPQRQWLGRLHVVMPVIQQMRRIAARPRIVCQHHRMPRGLHQPGRKPRRLQFAKRPRRRPPAIGRMGRLGTDARNGQKFPQSRQRLRAGGGNVVQHWADIGRDVVHGSHYAPTRQASEAHLGRAWQRPASVRRRRPFPEHENAVRSDFPESQFCSNMA